MTTPDEKYNEAPSLDNEQVNEVSSLDDEKVNEVSSLDDVKVVETVELLLADNTTVNINLEKAKKFSKILATAFSEDTTEKKLDLQKSQIDGPTFLLIAEYINMHEDPQKIISAPLNSKIMTDVTNKRDADFIDNVGNDRQQLYNLISAANYLDMKSLLHLGCAKVASLIKGKPLDEVKETLSVKQEEEKKD